MQKYTCLFEDNRIYNRKDIDFIKIIQIKMYYYSHFNMP